MPDAVVPIIAMSQPPFQLSGGTITYDDVHLNFILSLKLSK